MCLNKENNQAVLPAMVEQELLISNSATQEPLFEVIGESGDSDEDLSAMLHRLQVLPSENNIFRGT